MLRNKTTLDHSHLTKCIVQKKTEFILHYTFLLTRDIIIELAFLIDSSLTNFTLSR